LRKTSPGGQSLPKEEVLRKRADFDALFGTGERKRSGSLTLIYRRAPDRRVGFAVSGRLRSAARRNRAKRLMREAYRKNRWRMLGNAEFVVLADKNAWLKSQSEIERDLIACLTSAGITGD
jgi:ribonuclease P protein component